MGATKNLIESSEVRKHDSPGDVWIIIAGKVYDMTRFAPLHPGGAEIIYAYGGRDASEEYAAIHAAELISSTLRAAEQLGDLDCASQMPISTTPSIPDMASIKDKPCLTGLINLQDFEDVARKTLSVKNWAFINGASNDNFTRDANRKYYQKIWLRPRILRDVSTVSTRSTILGCPVSCPILIAPSGLATAGGPEGEIALSCAAAETGIIQTISTAAAFPLLTILEAAPVGYPFFFQLYVSKNRQQTEDLLRLVSSREQIKAVFVTVDIPTVPKREDDEREKLEPFHESAASAISKYRKSGKSQSSGMAKNFGSFVDGSLSWSDLKWIRDRIKVPLVLKGIQTAADAMAAMDAGCQGIVVSNHGGRSLDGATPAILVLLELRRHCPEVFRHMEVFIDGGLRRGSDVLKAICLGAKAVLLGRPYHYALNYGKEGVVHLTNVLKDEVATAMQLAGLTELSEADQTMLNTAELDLLLPQRFEMKNDCRHCFNQRASRL